MTNEDLEELEKLALLLEHKQLVLWIPQQVREEFARNREGKLASATKQFRSHTFTPNFPAMCKDYTEYAALRDAVKDCEKLRTDLLMALTRDIDAERLRADKVIQRLFRLGEGIERTNEIFRHANIRHRVGNPPGKKESLGDALNWESLLDKVPNEEDLHFISADGDFYTAIDTQKDVLDGFLAKEWRKKKKSSILPYRSLSLFFKANYPDIKLSSDLQRNLRLLDLETSRNFGHTHSAIARHNEYTDFSQDEVARIISAGATNSQIYWIMEDADVSAFFRRTLSGNLSSCNPEDIEAVESYLDPPEATVD